MKRMDATIKGGEEVSDADGNAGIAGSELAVKVVKFNFDGDSLDVVRLPDGDVGVCLRRLSEAVGVAYSPQRLRLRRAVAAGVSWATVIVSNTVANDGRIRRMTVLPRKSVPMWAATISLNHVNETARSGITKKLARYQDQCAEVLADHFLGPRVGSADNMLQETATLLGDREALKARIELLTDTRCSGLIGRERAQTWILAPLREAARIRCAIENDCSDLAFKREIGKSENQVRRHLRYPAQTGRTWEALPIDKLGEAVSMVVAIKARAEREWRRLRSAELERIKAGVARRL